MMFLIFEWVCSYQKRLGSVELNKINVSLFYCQVLTTCLLYSKIISSEARLVAFCAQSLQILLHFQLDPYPNYPDSPVWWIWIPGYWIKMYIKSAPSKVLYGAFLCFGADVINLSLITSLEGAVQAKIAPNIKHTRPQKNGANKVPYRCWL